MTRITIRPTVADEADGAVHLGVRWKRLSAASAEDQTGRLRYWAAVIPCYCDGVVGVIVYFGRFGFRVTKKEWWK